MVTINGKYETINSPFKWVGGKSRLRKQIIPLLPKHSCYVELFSGAAWVLFGKPPSDVEVLNDIDQDLVTFFRVIKEKPEELIASFEWELVSRAEFKRLASLDPTQLTDIQRAHRFYYLIMAGWGGELKYPRFQTSISDGGHGNRLIGAFQILTDANAVRTSSTVRHVPKIQPAKWTKSITAGPPSAGGDVGNVVSGSHNVPIERPASFSPSQIAHSNPKASIPT